jgi:glycosyltransferase involved in cell wall biosynthesis
MIDVSIVIPTFNRRLEVSAALDSVLAQANLHLECIVVDDCSTDGTVGFIRDRYKNQPVVVIEKPRRDGPQASRNLGISAARGEFVAFLDSDDYYEPGTLDKRVALCRQQQLDALFSGYRVRLVGRRWDLVKTVHTGNRFCPADYASALRDPKIAPTSCIMYRRAAYTDMKMDESLVSGHDDDLCLQLMRNGRHTFDDISSMNLVQHMGDHVATPRNLMIGDAQLLRKYERDLALHHGVNYLTRRRAHALAGLWSVGQFKRTSLLLPPHPDQGSMVAALALAALYLPVRIFAILRKRTIMAIVRSIL